jgi:F0F1-type ATP synthase membrane subunit b/b'
MAQLDTAAYLPQVFWLVLVFGVFYMIVIKNIVPTLSTILKVRTKKLSQGQELLEKMGEERVKIGAEYDRIIAKALKGSGAYIEKATKGWTKTYEGERCGKAYMKKVGEIVAKKGVLKEML